MLEIIDTFITTLLGILGTWGAVLGCIFILFESIIPILPLSVFITLNFITFGPIFGFVISWVFTVAGCMLSYYIFRTGVSEQYFIKMKEVKVVGRIIKAVEKMSFPKLTLLIAIPFTPAFAVNIAAGICRLNPKKFLASLIIGKISLVYFWGYIGVSLVESIKNPILLIKVAVICVVVYIISKIISKKYNIN